MATLVGVKAEKIGMISITENNALLSIFVKIPNITEAALPSTSEREVILKCKEIKTSKDDSNVFQFKKTVTLNYDGKFLRAYNSLISQSIDRANKFVKSRLDILKPYVLPIQANNSRSKRSLLAMLGLGGSIFSLALGAVSEYQIYKINNHLKENRADLAYLRQSIDKQQTEIVIMKENLISLVRSVTTDITHYLNELSCIQFYNLLEANLNNRFWHFSQLIDDLLSGGLNGQASMKLTPKLMDPLMIKNMIMQHPELSNTVFKTNPFLLYSIAKMTLVEINEPLSLAHFILDIPLIYQNDNSFKLFKTSQVGTFLRNNSCSYFSLPEYVYEDNDKFYVIELDECIQNNAFYICMASNLQKQKSCLQRDEITCAFHRKECANYYSYRMSSVGVLIRNNQAHQTYVINSTGWTSKINFTSARTAYVPWNNLQAMQIGGTQLISPLTYSEPLVPENFSVSHVSYNFIDATNISLVFKEVCDKYNASLNNVIEPFFRDNFPKQFNNNFIWLISLTSSVCLLIGWNLWILLQLLHMRYRTSKTEGELDYENTCKSSRRHSF